MNAIKEQKRADVRGNISCTVNFKVVTPKEYEDSKKDVHEAFGPSHKILKMAISDTDKKTNDIGLNPHISEFLIQMDEKLDLILSKISEKDDHWEVFEQGTGINISGSGMRMKVNRPFDQPFELGQILYTDFVLSQLPYIRINLYGKVIRLNPFQKSDGITYDMGIQFLEPDELTREQIFSRIFQLQRKAIRKDRQNQQIRTG